MANTRAVFVPYSEDYKNKCFAMWYALGRPRSMKKLLVSLPEDENSRKPTATILADWKRDLSWDLRADDLDSKALQIVDDALIVQKAEMLKKQAKAGATLLQKGLDYLETKEIDSASVAITAIIKGAELERISHGISELMTKLAKMSDSEVANEIARLSSRAESADVIDAEELEKENEQ